MLRSLKLPVLILGLLALAWFTALAQQGPTPPAQQPAPPAQQAPAQPAPGAPTPAPPQTPPGQGAPAAPEPPQQEGLRSYLGEVDPNLKYATGVQVRISQLEVGAFPIVRAFVSVLDQYGAQIKTLTPENFSVAENDTPAANVRFAKREDLDLPLSIMIVVDISGSMEPALQLEVQAVRDFVAQLGQRDLVGLVTFSDTANTNVPLTTDHAAVLRTLDTMVAFAQTALWDAIHLGMEELLADPTPARRAMIVLSDGMDNKSLETPQTILRYYDEAALQQNSGFSVYTLGLGEEIDRASLSSISLKTGGVYLDSPTAEDLAAVYKDILSQLQNEYLLEYDSPITSTPGQIIDVSVGIDAVQQFDPGTYTYRSPGLTKALARALWPGLIAICVLLVILILATIYKLTRRVWLTVQITALEGKDYVIGMNGAEIGTLESCQVRLRNDPALLPLHAQLEETTDGYLLSAVDPASPIILGGQLLARKLLRHGDRFTLGTTHFVFNERALRAGSGDVLPAEFMVAEPLEQLTEAAQISGAPASAKRQAPSTLVAVSGPVAGQRFELKAGENVIGRTEGSITLNADGQVSRKHCAIKLEPAGASLLDFGSTNGTVLNGARLQPGMAQAVHAGDELVIGTGAYRLE
jgi:VWFA-related protein